jgi:hypothetical protein
VAAEVAHDGVTALWQTPDGKWATAVALTGDPFRKGQADLQATANSRLPRSGIALGEWSPRRPVGVVAWGSTVSFRNVTLTPLTPGN